MNEQISKKVGRPPKTVDISGLSKPSESDSSGHKKVGRPSTKDISGDNDVKVPPVKTRKTSKQTVTVNESPQWRS